jgi:hypothetical protein
MKTIVDSLPDERAQKLENIALSPVAGRMTAAEGDALRAFRMLIFEHDLVRKFGGLRRVQTPSGDFL